VNRAALAFAADLVLVLVFVIVGRASHDENAILGVFTTLWPFAVGLVVAWAIGRLWKRPLAVSPSGVLAWFVTWAVGVLLRYASGQGIQPAFLLVSALVLALFLIGWRVVVSLVARRRAR
jgi:hypothetical protein